MTKITETNATKRPGSSLRAWGACLPIILLTVATLYGGGWAVVTVSDWPEHVVAGETFTIEYAVRGHGMHLTSAIVATPPVVARRGSDLVRTVAMPGPRPGYYQAELTLPEPGVWTVALTGYREAELLPLRVVAPGESPAPLPAWERGRQLFVAKGCNGCHESRAAGLEPRTPYGPVLVSGNYTPGYIRAVLADPAAVLDFDGWVGMPDLELSGEEISSLAAFLSEPEPTGLGPGEALSALWQRLRSD